MSFLDFSDVADFTKVPEGLFIEFKLEIKERKNLGQKRCKRRHHQKNTKESESEHVSAGPVMSEQPDTSLTFDESNALM